MPEGECATRANVVALSARRRRAVVELTLERGEELMADDDGIDKTTRHAGWSAS